MCMQTYLHGWWLLSEGGRLAGVLFPRDLELLGCSRRRCKGLWDSRFVRLLLPLSLLLLKVTNETGDRETRLALLLIVTERDERE